MAILAEAGECFACGSKLCRFSGLQSPRQTHRIIDLNRGERIETCTGGCVRFWTVISGTAAISTNLRDGRRQISGIERTGSTICGPMAHEDSPIWLEALEPCRICEIDFSADIGALQDDAGFMQAMFGIIHKRLETANRHLTTLGRLDSIERVTLFLAEMAEAEPGHGPVHLPMNREEIADYLGLNAETISRIFTKLRKAGLFKFLSPTEFVVADPQAVARRLPVPVAQPPHNPIALATDGTACPMPGHAEMAGGPLPHHKEHTS